MIGGIGNANFDLWMSGQRPQNFYMLGSMGLAIPIAFGVAIAQPQRHVVALEGDGSLLMQLGCLSTVAVQAPKNLTIVVWDNGLYQITGGQPTASAAGADLVAIAARLGDRQRRLGCRRGRLRPPVHDRDSGFRAEPDRRAHRQQAGNRHDRPRSGADPPPFHGRPRREANRQSPPVSARAWRNSPGCPPSSPCAPGRTGCWPPSWSSDWRDKSRPCAG